MRSLIHLIGGPASTTPDVLRTAPGQHPSPGRAPFLLEGTSAAAVSTYAVRETDGSLAILLV
ncbi:hypothetical protein [Kribbella rubisoli]|uniref:hypothetical protein n=1 Tax=Kribbella rubisoli TaxID=3075929 RepID=UPI00102C03E0|nr:hypothetical protein [Kribbella rubisoli]